MLFAADSGGLNFKRCTFAVLKLVRWSQVDNTRPHSNIAEALINDTLDLRSLRGFAFAEKSQADIL